VDAWVQVDGGVEGKEFDFEKELAASEPPPANYFIGQELEWEAARVPIHLAVELPYWLMVPNATIDPVVDGCPFQTEIRDDCFDLHQGDVTDSRFRRIYIGPVPPDLEGHLSEDQPVPIARRKCKTVVRLSTTCNGDVLAAAAEGGRRARVSRYYLAAFCSAHLPVVNALVRAYRLATYDFFPFELSPWDVPVWFVTGPQPPGINVVLMAYREWDGKPLVGGKGHPMAPVALIGATDLQAALGEIGSPGELELLDALNLIERGDYAGAVCRVATSIEVVLEAVLRRELSSQYPGDDVERRLKRSRMNVPGRLLQYEKLSGRVAAPVLHRELDRTRTLRHAIVHDGLRLPYVERAFAERSVETGRWLFNWLENDPTRTQRREARLGMRSLGRHFPLYDARITPNGVDVRPEWGMGLTAAG
jgi:hypothetical protein